MTPSPPSDPPPAPPPLNVPPSRARRQLAARLALHSQQKSESGEDSNETNEALEHEQSTSPNLNDHSDNDDDSGEDAPLQFGGPSHDSPKIVLHQANSAAEEESKKSPTAVRPSAPRRLSLDDFANSPAADPEDVGSSEDEGLENEQGHDVEMRVALG